LTSLLQTLFRSESPNGKQGCQPVFTKKSQTYSQKKPKKPDVVTKKPDLVTKKNKKARPSHKKTDLANKTDLITKKLKKPDLIT